MEVLKLLLNFVSAVIWPVTFLVVLYWIRSPLTELMRGLKESNAYTGRNLRLKMGQFEVESNIQEKIKNKLEEIAVEPSLEKRLEMAKAPILAEAAIQEIDGKSMEALNIMYQRRLVNAALINWYQPMDGVEPETYSKLSKLGLIQGTPMYDGDEVAWITPVGLAVLDKVNKQKMANKANSADAPKARAAD